MMMHTFPGGAALTAELFCVHELCAPVVTCQAALFFSFLGQFMDTRDFCSIKELSIAFAVPMENVSK